MEPPFNALPRDFYTRPTVQVARDLLGKLLVRRIGETLIASKVVETEAYLGVADAAAHSSRGMTARTRILFGPPGYAYVYQLRAYHLLNVVTEPPDTPTCVLFRALEPIHGIEAVRANLSLSSHKETELMNGPGKLCRALHINLSHYGADLTSTTSPLFTAEGSNAPIEIETSTRIGITKAVELPYRFTIKGNRFTSRPARLT